MYSNEIQIPLNIQRALFYFENDKLLSLVRCYRSITTRVLHALLHPVYYSFSFMRRLSCADTFSKRCSFTCSAITSNHQRRGEFLRLIIRWHVVLRSSLLERIRRSAASDRRIVGDAIIRASGVTRYASCSSRSKHASTDKSILRYMRNKAKYKHDRDVHLTWSYFELHRWRDSI